ncbi:xanthine dehydrogenase family protein molybdopterin-binding subunit [Cohnella sp. AR92]|uniref:xanthine dehydrogenase family protein molybdopterin-binding subunit n=1 Tax=Cohnella sp. AR92 TaxID=648716 RepID=UPI000F8EB9B0|nr:xanthine dehydrogenase family protein molybdopterin-binding subunit [Cohnella sp. AR92]RUS46898.1 xanthine dehydrogenase family protein molybdopterin-binding subunit [Cohnella sp. AR92]
MKGRLTRISPIYGQPEPYTYRTKEAVDIGSSVGQSIRRKETAEKVTGAAKYANDNPAPGLLHAKLAVSTHAHARILSIDVSEAMRIPGVLAVVTGQDYPVLTGSPLSDRPPLALDKVRYVGEPIALVVAELESIAEMAAYRIQAEYEPLPAVFTTEEALRPGAPVLHERMSEYEKDEEVYPEPGKNIANRTKIRKGNMEEGWSQCRHIVEVHIHMPQSDHASMEVRSSTAEIKPDGKVFLRTASQSPYAVRGAVSQAFRLPLHHVFVHTPLVGGGYGGKAAIQLEFLAYMASRSVGGRRVRITNSREKDMMSSPVHIGLDSTVKLGCTADGRLMAADIEHRYNCGAYADRGPIMSRAGAVDCTGPYRIDNMRCDSLCVYTNHPYCTSFRGFAHSELTFAMERAMDSLAKEAGLDPLEFRFRNAIGPGDTTPTQTLLTRSTVGDLPKCIAKLMSLKNWQGSSSPHKDGPVVKAIGYSCFWKNSSTPLNAGGGASLVFYPDGTVNLQCGAVEIGQGTRTSLTQIAAERLRMDVGLIHISTDIDTEKDPYFWKTVASRSTFLVGNAVLRAADDAIEQLKRLGSLVLQGLPEDLDVGYGRVFLKARPDISIPIARLAEGVALPNGRTVGGGAIIGRGSYTMQNLTPLDPETGRGVPGPEWTVGVQAVEVEYHPIDCTYRLLRAATVIDAGKVINPALARAQVTGGMSMGLGLGSRETFYFDSNGVLLSPQFRSYKLIRYGEQPQYDVEFVETPHLEAPYGLRGIGEHGIIGMPAALANGLSRAAGVELNRLPLTPERIWRTVHDPF